MRFFPTYYQKNPTLNVIKDFLTRCFASIKGLTEYMNLPVFCALFWINHYEISIGLLKDEVLCLSLSHFFFLALVKTSYFLHFLNLTQYWAGDLTPYLVFQSITTTTTGTLIILLFVIFIF